jgi:hypothetical protein
MEGKLLLVVEKNLGHTDTRPLSRAALRALAPSYIAEAIQAVAEFQARSKIPSCIEGAQ